MRPTPLLVPALIDSIVREREGEREGESVCVLCVGEKTSTSVIARRLQLCGVSLAPLAAPFSSSPVLTSLTISHQGSFSTPLSSMAKFVYSRNGSEHRSPEKSRFASSE